MTWLCTISHDGSGLLQACRFQVHLFFRDQVQKLVPLHSSTKCYSWNYDTAQFDRVHFYDQVHIHRYLSPDYSPNGKLLACWSHNDSHIQIWDTQAGYLISNIYGVSE